MSDRAVVLTVVAAYLVVCVGVGIWASLRTRTAADFFVAGRGIGAILFGFASFSTVMSGFGFIGGPGLVYTLGTSSFWICLPAGFGFMVSMLIAGKRLRVFAELFEVMTLPDLIHARYQSRTCRLLAALVVLLGVVGYLGTQILAFGMVAETFFGIRASTGILIGVGVIAFYAVSGGIIAGLYTDVVQGALMVFASTALFFTALRVAGDGSVLQAPARITEAVLASETPAAVGPWGLAGPMLCLSLFFVFSLGVVGQPHVTTKFLMVRRVTDLRWGGVISVLAYSLCTLLWISVGFAMKYLVLTGVEPALAKPDHAAPLFLLHHTPAWLAGLVFAGLFSAIMSTADAFLNLGAAVFVHDLPRALLGRSLEREVLWARVSTCAIAAAGALLALSLDELVAALGIFSWGTFAAALVPVMIGLGWKRATWQAAAAAMTTGLVTHLGLELLHRYPSPANPSFRLPFDVDTGAVALLASVIVFIAVSFVTRPPELDARVVTAIEL